MPVRYLSDPELARLSSWPDEIAVEDVVTYFTLSVTICLDGWLQSGRKPARRRRSSVDAAVAGLDTG